MDALHTLSAAAAAALIASGRITSEALVLACFAQIDRREPVVCAWQFLDREAALAAARRRDRESPAGPLHGVPFGVKDIIDVAGMPIGFGTPIFDGSVSVRDAACVALLKEAGAVCLGKTVTTELAHFHPGATTNPHDSARTPGGSSSGSAAAVAAGMVPIAIGTQTTGSMIRPAAFCGVVGYKPTYRDVSLSGVYNCATSFDTVGIACRAVADVPLFRAAVMRQPAMALDTPQAAELKVGLFRTSMWHEADACAQAAVEGVGERLARAGATVVPFELPPEFDQVASLHRIVAGFEFARAITWERTNHGQRLSPVLLNGRVRDGLAVSLESYHAALDALEALRHRFKQCMAGLDSLLSLPASGEAPVGLHATGNPVFNTLWTALHAAAITVPVSAGTSGMPIGVQVAGPTRSDHRQVEVAEFIVRSLAASA